jgi:VCBS repeat-containing protein
MGNATIGQPTDTEVIEDWSAHGGDYASVIGQISISDPDPGQSLFSTTVVSWAGNLGSLRIDNIDGAGHYNYSVKNSLIQYLGEGDGKYETFTIASADGTTKDISFYIRGLNDEAVIGDPSSTDVWANPTESGNLVLYGRIPISDVDQGEQSGFAGAAYSGLGRFTIQSDGYYQYLLESSKVASLAYRETIVETVTVYARDNTRKQFNITIHGPDASPVMTSGSAGALAENGSGVVYQAAGSDPEGQALAWSLSGPDAARFSLDSQTGAVSFSASPDFEAPADVGGNNVYNINVIASDGIFATDKAVAITVSNVNEAPAITSGATTSFSENGIGVAYQSIARDPDAGTALSWSLDGADAALFVIGSTGAIRFKAAPNFEAPTDAGGDNAYDIHVTVSDGVLSSDKAVTITVANLNEGPVVALPIADHVSTEDQPWSFVVPAGTFADEDAGDILAVTATLPGGSALPSWLTFDAATRTFSGTPLNADVGSFSVKVTATDTLGASTSSSFALTVANTNDAPTVAAIADQGSVEDTAWSLAIPASTFADVDVGDSLTITATRANGSALPNWLSFDATSRTFSGTPLNADVGTLALKVTATDAAGASASSSFALAIANTNDAPVANADSITVDEDATTGNLWSVVLANDLDVDAGDVLVISSASATSALGSTVVFDAATRTLTYSADADSLDLLAPGVTATDSFSYTLRDASGATSTATANVTILGQSDMRTFTGSNGNDTLVGTPGEDTLRAANGNDIIRAGGGADILYGDNGDDGLFGEAGIDLLFGGSGNDSLNGGLGNDVLDGGAGNDQLTGGDGRDTFVFGASSGADRIQDFIRGQDHLLLVDGVAVLSQLQKDLNGDRVADTLLTLSNGGTIGLLGVTDLSTFDLFG